MKKLLLSILIGAGIFGVVYAGKTIGLEVGTIIATGLTSPREPISGIMLSMINILPYFAGVLAGIFSYIALKRKLNAEV